MVSVDRERVTILQDHYREVYTVLQFQDVESVISTWMGSDREITIEDITVSHCSIKEVQVKLVECAAPGPDGVSTILLKKCAASLAKPLAGFSRASLGTGQVPKQLKDGVPC